MKNYTAVDVGGTNTRVALYPETGIEPIIQKRIPTHGEGSVVDRIASLIAELWPSEDTVQAIGIAAPGPIDPKAGIIFSAPNISEWKNLPLQKLLEDRFHVPVSLGNDANLAALGEWKFGAGIGYHNLIYMTLSTGIGGGVIIDDRLLLGAQGLAAELGHITVVPDGPMCNCGHRGHLEAVASGPAIARYVREKLALGWPSSLQGIESPTAEDVSRAAHQGDEFSIQVLQRAGAMIGQALADYLHIFNAEIFILGGGLTHSGDFLLKPLELALRHGVMSVEYVRNLVITAPALGDDAGLLGALALAQMAEA